MGKSVAVMLVLVFLTASCVIVAKPVSGVTALENSWVSKAPMHVARSGLGAAVVNGRIYAIGGSTRSGQFPFVGGAVSTNEEYDSATDTWTFKKSMPTSRDVFAIAAYQNKIYCIGGYTSNGTIIGINEVYDPATGTWETKASMPTARGWLRAHVANDRIYLMGGYVPDNSSFGFSISAINEVYDPATDTWTTKASIPIATSDYTSAVVDNKIYIIGGLSKSPQSNLNQIYDPETDTWKQGAPMPTGIRYGAAGATTGVNAPKRIYFFGQFAEFGANGTQVYEPKHDSWTYGTIMPTNRLHLAVAVVNDVLYAIGGYTYTYPDLNNWGTGDYLTKYATVEQYTPFGYGTPDPSYLPPIESTPPEITVLSPESKTYTSSSVSLSFTVNKPAVWMGYSLDGKETVAITGNATIAGLSSGLHNVTVYANGTFGNNGASETVTFTVANEPEPSLTTLVATASGALVALIGLALLVYFKKRHH